MTAEEIFARLKAHALEGMVFHDEMSRYYDFLGLTKYRDCQRKHYEEETEGYICLNEYYMNHFGRFIPKSPMERPDVIPDSWYGYSRHDVDTGTKTSAVKTATKKWVEWEKTTKDLYEELCGELLECGEVAAAHFVAKFVKDVDYELAEASKEHIRLESVGYDLSLIISEQ